jgi:hypothetical protein
MSREVPEISADNLDGERNMSRYAPSAPSEYPVSPVSRHDSEGGIEENSENPHRQPQEIVHSPGPQNLSPYRTGDPNRIPVRIDLPVRRKPVPSLQHIQQSDPKSIEPKIAQVNSTSLSTWEKLGWLSLITIALGTIFILAPLGFIGFLWFGDWTDNTWHKITVSGWFTRAVTLSALVIRNAASFQASVVTAMLACVALERLGVLLTQVASISTIRNSNSGPFWLTWMLLKGIGRGRSGWAKIAIPTLALALTITTWLLQFISTVLLSDLGLGTIPGNSNNFTPATGLNLSDPYFTIDYRGRSTWAEKAAFYPAFAEYHEPVDPNDIQDGVSDTGLTLRAFLPILDQQERNSLKSYSGRATVLDARVACMRPNLTDERLHLSGDTLALNGTLKASLNASQLVLPQWPDGPIPWDDRSNTSFACLAPLCPPSTIWCLSICQPSGDNIGQLASVFESAATITSTLLAGTFPFVYGKSYLVLNISSGAPGDWLHGISAEDSQAGYLSKPGTPPLFYSNHNEWLDLLFSNDASLRMSVTLCYSAFDTADLTISATASQNRTEPTPSFNTTTQRPSFLQVRTQYGQSINQSSWYSTDTTARKIFQLSKRSWLPTSSEYYDNSTFNYITNFANMAGADDPTGNIFGSDFTALVAFAPRDLHVWTALESLEADPDHVNLLQDTLTSGASIAFAIQNLITTFTSIAYYDQLPNFVVSNPATRTDFVVATVPKGHLGFGAVVVVVGVHLLMLFGVCVMFFVSSEVSALGNAWMAVSQVRGELAEGLLGEASLKTDKQVGRMAKGMQLDKKVVLLRSTEGGRGAEMAEVGRE